MENPKLRFVVIYSSPLTFILFLFILSCPLSCAVKRRLKFKIRYKERVEKAIEYARTIEDFDNLVDPWALAFHCLSPNPSAFVLRNIEIEEKKSKC